MNNKRMNSLLLLAVLVGATVLLFTTCSPKEPPPAPLPSLTVRLTWLHQAQFAGLYLAADKGFYRDAGVTVELKPGGIEYPSIKMVTVGQDEIGMTSADQILLARAKGAKVVALAAMYQKSPAVLLTLKKSGITKPLDLRGKRIGIKYGDNSEIPIRALLRKTGLTDKDFTAVSVSYDPGPLIQGQVDAFADFAINAPLTVAEKGYDVNEILPADYGINMYADVIFSTDSVLAAKRPAVVAFLRATIRGYQYALDHPDEAVAATLRRDPNLKAEHERRMLDASIPFWKPKGKRLGEMQEGDWSTLNDILLTSGLLTQKMSLNGIVNYDLLKEAYR
jgi:NitT/TauT family transport system substrate-binding protein